MKARRFLIGLRGRVKITILSSRVTCAPDREEGRGHLVLLPIQNRATQGHLIVMTGKKKKIITNPKSDRP